jgi:hypothetical protein
MVSRVVAGRLFFPMKSGQSSVVPMVGLCRTRAGSAQIGMLPDGRFLRESSVFDVRSGKLVGPLRASLGHDDALRVTIE